MIPHSAERHFMNRLVGGLQFGIDNGMLVNADVAALSTLPDVVGRIRAKGLLRHVAERNFAARIIGSLNLINSYDSTYLAGADADKATMLALAPGARGGTLWF